MIKNNFLSLLACIFLFSFGNGYGQNLSVTQMEFLTNQWKGERFQDGRPKVADAILKRMKKVTIEEAWGF